MSQDAKTDRFRDLNEDGVILNKAFELDIVNRSLMEGKAGNKFKRVCVFCGSSSGNRSVFSEAALDLGHELVCLFLYLIGPLFFMVLYLSAMTVFNF